MSKQFHTKFFTIGHATRSLAAFIQLLTEAEVRIVVDVRTAPRSRTNPQFDRETLAKSLALLDIEYRHIAGLGGLRPRQKQIPVSTNAFWQNQSFHNYADYAMSREFQSGFEELRELGHAKRCAVMCAETLWWRCHRRIIADYLLLAGETVFHILGPGHLEEAHITPAAERGPDGVLIYPAEH
ncbi:MAG: DUF488 domain-containing protein [Rhizobiales bacterium]|nr:DUF488 domain-containing protein [Hyphomicrobiales bacterium]